ncbi:hypothetical protein LEMLEM_LOCUS7228 [Lemmus lemmus]
MRRGLFSQ